MYKLQFQSIKKETEFPKQESEFPKQESEMTNGNESEMIDSRTKSKCKKEFELPSIFR